MNESFYEAFGKRAVDGVLSSVGLLVLSPLLLPCAVLIKLTSPGPIFFRQIRTGLQGKPFQIYKFRSMYCGSEKQPSLLTSSGDPRITRVGYWLRKTKVDELPQLFNVLTGEMSLVGPRPEVPAYTAAYTQQQRRVLTVKPGITGLASIAFSSEEQLLAGQEDKEKYYVTTLMPYKIEMDLKYCGDITLLGDLRILLQTVLKLFVGARPMIMPTRNPADPLS